MPMQDTYDDIPPLVRGVLDPARARQILNAAENDAALRRAIEAERSLEEILDLYEPPEPSPELEGRFWRRFHGGEGGRGALWLKLAGPLAASVLIAIGVIAFLRGETSAPSTQSETVAEDSAFDDIDWDDVVAYSVGSESAPEKRELAAADLHLMRRLDNESFLALDRLAQAEDLNLADDLELLRALDALDSAEDK